MAKPSSWMNFDQLLDDSPDSLCCENHSLRTSWPPTHLHECNDQFDQEEIAPNTRFIWPFSTKVGQHPTLLHAYGPSPSFGYATKPYHVEDFRNLVFFTASQTLEVQRGKTQYRDILAVSLASDVNVKFRKVILESLWVSSWTLPHTTTFLLVECIDSPEY